MQRDRDNLKRLIHEHGFAKYEAELMQHARPSIRVYTTRVENEDELAIGESKIGGRPDLPEGIEWPTGQWYEGKRASLQFIAQFDLADVKPFDDENLLPEHGILFFFADYSGCYQFDDHQWVFYFNGDRALLSRRPFPDDLYSSDYDQYNPCRVEFIPEVNLPEMEEASPLPKYEQDFDEFFELLSATNYDEGFGDINRLLGYNYGVAKDMQLECEILSRGLPLYELSYEQKLQYSPMKNQWQLLLRMSSDRNAGMMWSDLGVICFYIRREALKNRNFDRVRLTFFSS